MNAKDFSKNFRLLIIFFTGLCIITILFYPSLKQHFVYSANPLIFNDDVRQQIWPFDRYNELRLNINKDDLIANYYLDNMPIGYYALYSGWTTLFDNPRLLSSFLPYFTLLSTLCFLSLSANRLNGMYAGWTVVAFVLSLEYLMARMNGGLPRAFGPPITAATLWSFLNKRNLWLSLTTIFGAAFYPVAGLISGVCLGIKSFSWYNSDKFLKSIATVIITAIISIIILSAPIINGRKWGPLINENDIFQFPEAGKYGRYDPKDSFPYPGTFQLSLELVNEILFDLTNNEKPHVSNTLIKSENPFFKNFEIFFIKKLNWVLILFFIEFGLFYTIFKKKCHELLIYLIVVLTCHNIAIEVAPLLYVPSRYLDYAIPIMVLLFLSIGIFNFSEYVAQKLNRPSLNNWIALGISLVLFLNMNIMNISKAGFTIFIESENPIYKFFENIKEPVLIAGWPEGEVNNIPYLFGHSVLLSYETHQAFHKKYTLLMRKRMEALIEAYYSDEIEPLLRLKDEFDVTHLIIDTDLLNQPSYYFQPFTDKIMMEFESFRKNESKSFLRLLIGESIVLNFENYRIIDLRSLDRINLKTETTTNFHSK